MQIIDQLRSAIINSDGESLIQILNLDVSISNSQQQLESLQLIRMNGGSERVVIPELGALNSKKSTQRAERYAGLLMDYLEFCNALVIQLDFNQAAQYAMNLISDLTKISETEEFWIIFPLMNISDQVRLFITKNYTYIQDKLNQNSNNNETDTETPIDEKLVSALQKPFKLCLSDKSDAAISKKTVVYFFATLLFKVYFKFNKFEAANNIFKVLQSAPNLPDLNQVLATHRVNYRYYCGVISCMKDDLNSANEFFTYSLNQCERNATKQQEKILLLLLPIKFLMTRKLPSDTLWNRFPRLVLIFKPLFDALKAGDIYAFDQHFELISKLLLKKKIYSIYLRFKPFIFLKLLRQTMVIKQVTNNQLKLQDVQLALKLSCNTQGVASLDEIEAKIAYLISKSYIKGYLSHGNRVLVLSKTLPFPKLAV